MAVVTVGCRFVIKQKAKGNQQLTHITGKYNTAIAQQSAQVVDVSFCSPDTHREQRQGLAKGRVARELFGVTKKKKRAPGKQ